MRERAIRAMANSKLHAPDWGFSGTDGHATARLGHGKRRHGRYSSRMIRLCRARMVTLMLAYVVGNRPLVTGTSSCLAVWRIFAQFSLPHRLALAGTAGMGRLQA